MSISRTRERHARELYELLQETAAGAGIELVETKLNRRGGVCRLDGRLMVIFDLNAPWQLKNDLILEALARLDEAAIYLPPRVRELLAVRSQTELFSGDAG